MTHKSFALRFVHFTLKYIQIHPNTFKYIQVHPTSHAFQYLLVKMVLKNVPIYLLLCYLSKKTVWQQWTHSTCGPRFVDCDDLNDLTRLFSYVGQDTETLVVLASPDILTRKWCVGEICTARISRLSCVSYAVSFLWKPRLSDSEKTKNKQRVLHHKRELKPCSLLENFGASKEDSEIMTGVAHMTNVYHRFMTFMT